VFPLGPIARAAFSQFIVERFASTGLSISAEAVAHLLDITDGHAHDTQKLGYFTWSLAQSQNAPASFDTVEQAYATAISTDTARYTELWDGFSGSNGESPL
jgi:hypothetical protein